jgi:hypothetical protein
VLAAATAHRQAVVAILELVGVLARVDEQPVPRVLDQCGKQLLQDIALESLPR